MKLVNVCKLTSAVCNSRQIWNKDKCRCEFKEDLIDKGICDKRFAWNPSNCQSECDKSCGIGEYLDYKTCVCRNTLIDKLVEECTKNNDNFQTLNTISSHDCASCMLHVVLFAVFLTTGVIIGGAFLYFHYYLKRNDELDRKKEKEKLRFNSIGQLTNY